MEHESLTPSIEDLNGDANVRPSAVIDIIESYLDADDFVSELDRAFGYDQPLHYDDDELEAMYAASMEGEPAAKWEPFDLPAPQSIDTVLRLPNPAAWGKAVSS